jgi:hypothetical protein
VVLIRQRPGSVNGVVFVTIEDETGIANLIVWLAILERFRRAALGAILLRRTGKLQREKSVVHVVAECLDDLTSRLRASRDCTGDIDIRHPPKPPFAPSARPPGYDPPRDCHCQPAISDNNSAKAEPIVGRIHRDIEGLCGGAAVRSLGPIFA